MSRIAYFKRKYVEDEDPHLSFRSYCQTVAPALEERAHVLRLSLEKMRFIDDPEAFLRRSVLVNNLLRRLRAEILLQSDWCLPPGLGTPATPCILPPTTVAHQAHHGVPPRPCLVPQGPPFRKRFRLVRGELRPECVQTCCCFYPATAAGHYLHLPFSVYEGASTACPSTPHSSPSLFQLEDSRSRLGLAIEEEDDDEEEEEREEEDEEEEQGLAGPSADAKHRQRLRNRIRTRTSLGRGHRCGKVKEERKENEEEEEEEEERLDDEDSDVMERGLQGVSLWSGRGQRQ